jgi:inner membrane protein
LFLIVVFVLGTWLYRRAGRVWLLTLAFGTALHLILDQAWVIPRTLFWPLYGFAFTKGDLTGWLPQMVRSMYTDPEVYLPEITGFLVIAVFAWQLLRQRKVVSFIRRGRL